MLRYFDYLFTGVFTFEMIIKVSSWIILGFLYQFLYKESVCKIKLYNVLYKYAVYVVIFFSDDWAGFDLTWWLLFPWLVEHSGFHSCSGRFGGLCSHVSRINPNMRNNKCNLMFCWWIWNCLAAFFVIHFQMPLMPCDNSMSYVRKSIQTFQILDTYWC